MNTIGIAMSGGVDSSVSAAILRRQNFDVHGFFMKLPLPGVDEHLDRVRAVAGKLEIPLTIVDLEELFTRYVINVFIDTYRQGLTPNPCIVCNQRIKFGALRKYMHQQGMSKIATGHYARIARTMEGQFAVQRGIDPKKDQSYFLCRLNRDQLEHMVMPLGELSKNEVYRMAAELNLDKVHGPESQDICFLTGRNIAIFFTEQGVEDNPGTIVTSRGATAGRHRGLWHYTIGQRRGLGLPDETPWYVQRLDAQHNRVIICKNEELITSSVRVSDVRWTVPPSSPWQGLVQIRGRHRPSGATLEQVSAKTWLITFAQPQRAVTPGQFAAFYQDDLICGSGVILPDDQTTAGTGS
jgi:tRNA-specific 2-thiouridylase